MGQAPWEALVPSDSLVGSITVMEVNGKRDDCRVAVGQRAGLARVPCAAGRLFLHVMLDGTSR